MSNNNNTTTLSFYSTRLFEKYLSNEDITEIVINDLTGIWYENQFGWYFDEQSLDISIVLNFITSVAVFSDQVINEKSPQLDAVLINQERIKIIIPPACSPEQILIVIRKPSKINFTFDFFVESGFFNAIKIDNNLTNTDRNLISLFERKEYADFLKLAVSSGTKNIVIVGKTGSGKTSFAKSLLNFVSQDERLISIEDTRELTSSHKNFAHLLYSSQNKSIITPIDQLKNCLRMKPDRILLSELRGGEAFAYIRAISSGHGGSITTLHAGNFIEAINQLVLMFLQNETGSAIPYDVVKGIIEDTIDIFVCINNENGKRFIHNLHWTKYKTLRGFMK